MSDKSKPQTDYTRRDFLMDLGKTGGIASMYGTMGALGLFASPAGAKPVDFVPLTGLPSGKKGNRIIVIGAGIAGLTAAYELIKVGYDVTILEARDRVGNRDRWRYSNLSIRSRPIHELWTGPIAAAPCHYRLLSRTGSAIGNIH